MKAHILHFDLPPMISLGDISMKLYWNRHHLSCKKKILWLLLLLAHKFYCLWLGHIPVSWSSQPTSATLLLCCESYWLSGYRRGPHLIVDVSSVTWRLKSATPVLLLNCYYYWVHNYLLLFLCFISVITFLVFIYWFTHSRTFHSHKNNKSY